jgi:dolichol-phosphate mannosyltransferase
MPLRWKNSKLKLSLAPVRWLPLQVQRVVKFCLVGLTGLGVDMLFLFFFNDPRWLGLNVTISKFFAAELAMINNFVWNELWTFHESSIGSAGLAPVLRRFALFNCICGIGIGFAILLLHFFHRSLGLGLYLSNFLAILLVTLWNFSVNARWNWRTNR